ncbi:MAG: squalene/phytoene synthase family protein [Steroidobacteraceae bacterium]
MKLDESLLNRAVPAGSMRYYAWLYTPAEHRDVLAALFLIESELHDSARAAHEVAHIRLQWWREEIDQLIAGKARHPATQVLQAATNSHTDLQLLQQALLSSAQELANATYETDSELDQYFRNGLGSLFAIASQLLSRDATPQVNEAATQLGAFVRQVESLRDLRNDFHHGRLYLPLNKLDELNIQYEALQSTDWPASFVQLLKSRSEQQLAAYKILKQGLLSSEKQTLRPLLVLSELHAQVLQVIAKDPAANTQQRVELGPIKKLWTAWNAARVAS